MELLLYVLAAIGAISVSAVIGIVVANSEFSRENKRQSGRYETSAVCRAPRCLFSAIVIMDDGIDGRLTAQAMITEVARGHVALTGHEVRVEMGSDQRTVGPYCDQCRRSQPKSGICEDCLFAGLEVYRG